MKDIMLLFDLDGTLWDSGEGVVISWNQVLQSRLQGFPLLTLEDIHGFMGKTMDEISLLLLPEESEKVRKDVFDACMANENAYLTAHGGVLFPDVRETLAQLAAAGYKMAVVSNCQCGYIPAFLKSMDMEQYFCDYLEWGETLQPKSYNISLCMKRNGFDKGIYIGDTEKDGDAARTAGVPFIYASYGFGTDPAPDWVLSRFRDLPEAVENLISRV